MLATGILYGVYHQSRLSKKETAWRKVEAEKKVIRDAQLAIEKKKNYEGESTIKIKLSPSLKHSILNFTVSVVFFAAEMRALEELSNPAKKVAA